MSQNNCSVNNFWKCLYCLHKQCTDRYTSATIDRSVCTWIDIHRLLRYFYIFKFKFKIVQIKLKIQKWYKATYKNKKTILQTF